MLRELFEALGNDPLVIAECLARPALAERLLTSWYAHDERIHGELKQRTQADLLAHPSVEQMKQLSGNYSEIELIRSDSRHEENRRAVGHGVQLNSREWDETVQKAGGNVWRSSCSGRRVACKSRDDNTDQNRSIERIAGRRDALLCDGSNRENRSAIKARYSFMAEGAVGIVARQSRKSGTYRN